MMLVDTSVLAAWLDADNPLHKESKAALLHWAGQEQLVISSVSYAELAAGLRQREGVDESLAPFDRVELDFESAWRAGMAFRKSLAGRSKDKPVLPDFFIRAQAATMGWKHLTNDRRRRACFPEVEFVFPEDS